MKTYSIILILIFITQPKNLESAFRSPSIPADILTILLNLAEFMEQDSKTLPIDTKILGQLAIRCGAFAKALHYRELEFRSAPKETIASLISINNELQQPEAAVGILKVGGSRLKH